MAETLQISSNQFQLQTYDNKDTNLISVFDVNTFINQSGYIEFFAYDLNGNILSSNYNFLNYSVGENNNSEEDIITQLNISPENDLIDLNLVEGSYISSYNFLLRHIGDQFTKYYISEISSDRTEIRLDSNIIDPISIIEETNLFIDFREDKNYFVDFYLNFGENNLIIANNIKLDEEDIENPTVLIKLYEPLPTQFDSNDELWIVTTLNEPENYQINFGYTPEVFTDFESIEGPNFSIPLKDQINNSSENLSYTDIISNAPSSSQNQLDSLLEEKSINISINYTDFSEFIHFSSIQTRIENFYHKVGLIESASNTLLDLNQISNSTSNQLIEENKIKNTIKSFDKFEYFMYYSSGSSTSYPKSNSELPYTLMSTGSAEVLTWLGSTNEQSSNFGGLLLSASNFDNANPDELKKAIPEYLRIDPANQQYDLFVDMVAQYYDNIWMYTKDITQKYNADNRLGFGVSKDLVSDAIKDFGLKLYQNNFSNQELYTTFLGITPSGSLFPFPEISTTTPTPKGMEFVDTLISASNDVVSMDDTNKSLYKRIYHNIPYLLKSKGTLAGLRALITSYGIPDTILKISEFGGKDKVNANDYDLYSNNFNYAFNASSKNSIVTPWKLNNLWNSPTPNTIQFRVKFPNTAQNYPTQSIWHINNTNSEPGSYYGTAIYGTSLYGSEGSNQASNPDPLNNISELYIEYDNSTLTSSSHEGSIINPNHEYATLKLIPNGDYPEISASLYLPFFNGDWWSIMITVDEGSTIQNSGSGSYYGTAIYGTSLYGSEGSSESTNGVNGIFSLHAGNKIYNGNNGTSIGYYDSSSVEVDNIQWTTADTSFFGSTSPTLPSPSNSSEFSLQEIRYYNTQISKSVFKDYVMNPLSIEGNEINSAPDQLSFRVALGSNLDISTTSSIHPKVTGSWTSIPSFQNTSNFIISGSQGIPSYSKNTEIFFQDQPAVGIKNRTTDKIRLENDTLPSGSVLSPFRSLSQTIEASASYTPNINYLEVAFSPQNQINDDIIGQLGHFNIGDYIGDPRQRFKGNNYSDLNNLSEEYFKKYIKNYDLVDFVRLIKFFDNSLFKMIKDFIPAKTSLASGIVIKQHLLERNKYPQPQMSYSDESELSGSISVGEIEGGAGGMLNQFNSESFAPGGINNLSITQSWSVVTPTISGSVTTIQDSQDEFYNGELSGSLILATNGELNEHCEQFKNANYIAANYKIRMYDEAAGYIEDKFLDPENKPTNGHISIFINDTGSIDLTPITSSSESSNSSKQSTDSPSTGSTQVANIPTSFKVYHALNGNVADIGFYNSATTDFKWLWNEGVNNGTTIDISSSLGTGGYTRLLPINQFGDVIYDFDLNNISVVQQGGADVTSEWTITKEGGSTINDPDRIKFQRNANAQLFTGNPSTDNIYLNFDITSSITTAGTDNTGDASFNIKPAIDAKYPYGVSGITASLYNKIPEYNIGASTFSYSSTLSGESFAGGNDVYSNGTSQMTFTNESSATKTAVFGGSPLFRNGVGDDWTDGSLQSTDGLRFVTGGGNATRGGSGVTAWAVEDSTYNSVDYFNIGMSSNGALEIGYDGTDQGGLNFYWVYFYVQDVNGNSGNFTIPKTLSPYTPSDYKIFAVKVSVSF